ncbi:hypothetical protein [Nonlabens sp. Asnod3-A02]|uniref:hypothetical protein n=1 Tax=Nonlabens sp. Asnod3-A02 TaxID=3160579 RepID=UPI00386F94D4
MKKFYIKLRNNPRYFFTGLLLTPFILAYMGLSVIDLWTTYVISDHRLSNLDFKVWSHAGFIKDSNFELDSMESFEKAKSNGAKGIEIDVIYDVDMDEFIVSHDFPYKLHNNEPLKLDSVFTVYKEEYNYWLDFKNLKDLEETEVKESFKNLVSLLEKKNVSQDFVLIESVHLKNLSYFTKNNFYTSWWITPSKSRYLSHLRNYSHKLKYILGEYSSLSMPYKYYERVEEPMNNIPVNLWTINDKDFFHKVKNKKQIKIILTDNNWYD